MYLRRCYRRKDGKRHAYWALVESYRTSRGPRQRVVAWLGVMDERGRLGVKRCAEKQPGYQTDLFTRTEPEWVEVDVKRVRVERSRKFGGPWLGRELLRRLELDRFLEERLPNGREEIPWSAMAMILILGRLCEPSSELHLAEHLYEASAMSDLLESIAWAHTSWFVFWPTCCGRRWPPAAVRADSAMNHGKSLKSSVKSPWSM